jgi:hypothetical protein
VEIVPSSIGRQHNRRVPGVAGEICDAIAVAAAVPMPIDQNNKSSRPGAVDVAVHRRSCAPIQRRNLTCTYRQLENGHALLHCSNIEYPDGVAK